MREMNIGLDSVDSLGIQLVVKNDDPITVSQMQSPSILKLSNSPYKSKDIRLKLEMQLLQHSPVQMALN